MSQMTEPGWDLPGRTLEWAAGGNTLDFVLFTHEGTLDPDTDKDGLAVYEYLIGEGHSVTVYQQMDISNLPTANYDDFDMVLYVNSYGWDAGIPVSAGVPLVTWQKVSTRS